MIPDVIFFIGSVSFRIDEAIINLLGNICANCSSTLIPQLLEMNIPQYLVFLGLSEPMGRKASIRGLRGIIRYCKEISNPELFKSYVDVEKLVKTCRELVSDGVHAAKHLLRDVHWVISEGERETASRKKHKSAD